MRNPFSSRQDRPRVRKPDPWDGASRESSLTAEEEQQLELDDLAQLLAATNAKRAARGKRHVSQSDVELRVWSLEQEAHRPAPAPAPAELDPENPWGD